MIPEKIKPCFKAGFYFLECLNNLTTGSAFSGTFRPIFYAALVHCTSCSDNMFTVSIRISIGKLGIIKGALIAT